MAALPDEFKTGAVPPMFRRLETAYNGTWKGERLEQIGKVMQLWEGQGKFDKLDAGRLKSHKAKPVGGKGKPVWQRRWRTPAALFFAARLICQSLATLRGLLATEEPLEELLTSTDRDAQAEAQAAAAEEARGEAEAATAAVREELRKTRDGWAHARARNKSIAKAKRAAAKEAKQGERTRLEEKHRVAIKAAKVAAAAKLAERREAERDRALVRARGDVKEVVAKLKRFLANARARANKVEEQAK
eukprot:3802987-Prymnesium_polylepis.1